MRRGLPDRGDVPRGRRHRRLRQGACIGCKACIAACPYDAIFINPEDHSAEKCNFCAHRLDVGLEPACVVVCPIEAILVGDLDDPASRVAQIVNREPVTVGGRRRSTRPKLFYKGAHQATLDPARRARPDGGLFMWSEQAGPAPVTGGRPGTRTTRPPRALLSYDVPHRAPWDWRVSLYTWTKGIAAGAYLVALALLLAGSARLARLALALGAPLLAARFLALTGAILIWDLEHPRRFYFIFTAAAVAELARARRRRDRAPACSRRTSRRPPARRGAAAWLAIAGARWR